MSLRPPCSCCGSTLTSAWSCNWRPLRRRDGRGDLSGPRAPRSPHGWSPLGQPGCGVVARPLLPSPARDDVDPALAARLASGHLRSVRSTIGANLGPDAGRRVMGVLLAFAVGYVVGARAGAQDFDDVVRAVQELRDSEEFRSLGGSCGATCPTPFGPAPSCSNERRCPNRAWPLTWSSGFAC